MKKRFLSILLALLICMLVIVPTFADGETETPPDRAGITVSFGLKHLSGSTYRMWAKIINLNEEPVTAALKLMNGSYIKLVSIGMTSSEAIFYFYKDVSLLPGTYHLRLSYAGNTVSQSVEKTYYI